MLSKIAEKYIKSLRIKKQRYVEKKYIAEGRKIAEEYIKNNVSINEIYATLQWIKHNEEFITNKPTIKVTICESFELKKVSVLTTPSDVLLICDLPLFKPITPLENHVILALDNIQDPGNMGTIIRTADWMGINTIICNDGCVDIYNPKVIQASMGSLPKINILETNLIEFLKKNNGLVYAGMLDGENIFNTSIIKPCVLIIGNEGAGIQSDILPFIDIKVTIPSHGSAESLNVAIAASILMTFFSVK